MILHQSTAAVKENEVICFLLIDRIGIMQVHMRGKRNSLHQQHINRVTCLPGGRQALGHVVCWRPQQQAAIPQQHLHGTSEAQGQHVSGRTNTHTHTHIKSPYHSKHWTQQTFQPLGYIFIRHLWPEKSWRHTHRTNPHKQCDSY